ncbi:unnamed protein product [Linum trigynum]|uniref:Uncharacterized protein n=1 Tax=Linum trigynum TaxID=586398 RepID=A0AAV2DV81_9ROSI
MDAVHLLGTATATTDGRERGRMEAAARGDAMRRRSGRGGCARKNLHGGGRRGTEEGGDREATRKGAGRRP